MPTEVFRRGHVTWRPPSRPLRRLVGGTGAGVEVMGDMGPFRGEVAEDFGGEVVLTVNSIGCTGRN